MYKTLKPDQLPSPAQWKSASSVALAFRDSDIILDRIDKLIAWIAAETDDHQKMIEKSDLYFTTEFWLQNCAQNPAMEKGRKPAIEDLRERAALSLCSIFECTRPQLPWLLEEHWGRPLTLDGVKTDYVKQFAKYLTDAEAQKYRLWFKKGLVYEMSEKGRVLLNSSKYYSAKDMVQIIGSMPAENYGCFVLTMNRNLYMAKHNLAEISKEGTGILPKTGFYHSSYVAGSPVQCAGSMLIENGTIKRIRLNSGHYRPNHNNMRSLLMALRMWGVAVEMIAYEIFTGEPLGGGTFKSVLSLTNDPEEFKENMEKYKVDKDIADKLILDEDNQRKVGKSLKPVIAFYKPLGSPSANSNLAATSVPTSAPLPTNPSVPSAPTSNPPHNGYAITPFPTSNPPHNGYAITPFPTSNPPHNGYAITPFPTQNPPHNGYNIT